MTPKEWLLLKYGPIFPSYSDRQEQGPEIGEKPLSTSVDEVELQHWMEKREKEEQEMLSYHARDLLTADELGKCNEVYVGIFPTREPNAVVGKTPDGDMFVAINLGLSYYLRLWTDLLAYVFIARQRPTGLDSALCIKSLAHLSILTKTYDNPKPLPFRDTLSDVANNDKKMLEISEGLYHAGLAFFIGHEFGHIINGHYRYLQSQPLNHQLEYEADGWGQTMATRFTFQEVTRKMGPEHPSFVFYSAFSIMGPAVALGIGGLLSEGATKTHPSSEDRYRGIRKHSAKILSEVDKRSSGISHKRILKYGEDIHREIGSLGQIVKAFPDEFPPTNAT